MQLLECDAAWAALWDDFVRAQGTAEYAHLFSWKKIIEEAYGHVCPYLMAVDGGTVLGVLPLAIVNSRFFGSSITSLPFLDSAGLLVAGEEVGHALADRAYAMATEQRIDYLELRQTEQIGGEFRVDTHKVSLTRKLEPDIDALWNSLSSERRNRVRKAQKQGLQVEFGGAELLTRFYRVWSKNMRDLGSPAHSLDFFRRILHVLSDIAGVLLVRHGNLDIGAAVTIVFKGKLSVPWVSSLRSHFAFHPNDILYWEAMKLALERGCPLFDFGRSTIESGNYTYKVRWGAEARPLYWHYRSIEGHSAALVTGERPGIGIIVEAWKRMPVTLCNWLGPLVRKNLTS